MTTTPALLQVGNLKTEFRTDQGTVTAVDEVSFRLAAGETLCLVGESGSGKSVTALSIMGLLADNGRVAHGSILFEDQDLVTLPERQLRGIRGNSIAMIFQEPMTSLNPVLTIGDQLSETVILHLGLSRAQARERVIELLAKVGIPRPEEIVDDYPHRLSGGMRQRAMIAMALSCAPKLIIADEPTTALDVTIQAQILKLIRDLSAETGTAMILITHDLGVVAEMADRVAVMYAGQVVEEADVFTLFDEPKHPYTIALMRSVPHISTPAGDRLASISGSVPSLLQMPTGCRFHERCPHAMDRCRDDRPELLQLSGQNRHTVRCWLYDDAAQPGTTDAKVLA
ncbi:ABC transporter ATP-binding protein [Kribbella albertanoniae]|uniref:ABC transporter ATP-binding protein n=1 Tax=Kribbella albertanoniae TaxID=1266829 RepID=UPI0023525C1B|nr:ABC transporter ATP-binding protein [Kribbella albertanoniae]